MIKNKYVTIPWKNSTRKRYEKLGYVFTNYNELFDVKIDDMSPFSEVNITAICENCGIEKQMTLHAYNSITKQQSKPYICRDCFLDKKIIKYEDILNDVDSSGYILLTTKNEYKNGNTMIRYVCPKHGEQKMKAANFHNGKRCRYCYFESAHDKYSFTPDEVYKKVLNLGGELLNKEDYINQDKKNLKIICPRCHKNILTTSLKHFQQHGGQSCDKCYKKESVGERRIRQWLEAHEFIFEQEKWFDDCRDINPLPFDFYLQDLNTIIEFDGKQHFEENHFFSHINNFGNSVTSYTQYHDQIKNDYCKNNNINLIRIPYTQINNIEKILKENLIA